MAGVEPLFEVYAGEDPLSFVVSENIARRHLSTSQRAKAAEKLATFRLGDNQYQVGPQIQGPTILTGKSAEEAARVMNVSRASVENARRIQRHGVPELVKLVEEGKTSNDAARVISHLPAAEQREIIEQGPAAVKKKRQR